MRSASPESKTRAKGVVKPMMNLPSSNLSPRARHHAAATHHRIARPRRSSLEALAPTRDLVTPMTSLSAPEPSEQTTSKAGAGTSARLKSIIAASPPRPLPGSFTPGSTTYRLAIGVCREQNRLRNDYHGAEKTLEQRRKTFARRVHIQRDGCTKKSHLKCGFDIPTTGDEGEVCAHLLEAKAVLATYRKKHERHLENVAVGFPAYVSFVDTEQARGFGKLVFGQMIAEAGDLSDYAGPAKLWKRFGLAPGQRKVKNVQPGDPAGGFCPRRRSVSWNVGECLIKAGGHYKSLYDSRKKLESEKPACGKVFRPGKGSCEKDGHCLPKHIHARAHKWMEKRLLKDLWTAWRAAARARVEGKPAA